MIQWKRSLRVFTVAGLIANDPSFSQTSVHYIKSKKHLDFTNPVERIKPKLWVMQTHLVILL